MTPLQIESHLRHKRFHQVIAQRAALVPPVQRTRTYTIPNTPFGIPKMLPVIKSKPIRAEFFYHCMWFFDLVQLHAPRAVLPLSVERIQIAVCNHFNISRTDMLSQRRTVNIVRPRQVGYYISKKLTQRSLPEIGRRFAGRDHTSILSGIRKIEKLRQTNLKLEADLHAIVGALGGSLG